MKDTNKNLISTQLSFLFSRLKINLKSLRSEYTKIVQNQPENQKQQILYDNFYILEKMSKNLIKQNKKSVVLTDKKSYPVIGNIIYKNCVESNLPSTENLISALSSFSNDNYISNLDYELLTWEFRYTLLQEFYDNYFMQLSDTNLMNIIILLTKSDSIDVSCIIKSCNPLELILLENKNDIYSQMNEDTKRIYRNRISYIARKKKIHETELAKEFIKKSKKQKIHIGEFIYSDYNLLKSKLSPKKYILSLSIVSISISIFLSIIIKSFILWILFLIPIFEIVKSILDLCLNFKNEITYLPRLKSNNIISENAKTIVVLSTLITSVSDIKKLKSKLLNIHHTNPFDNIQILALCDLKEFNLPNSPDDELLVRNCKRLIIKLNQKYSSKFSIIIRNRVFSKTQNIFTGYERKRGAIEQLVKFIKGDKINFLCLEGNAEILRNSAYMITLDFDTKPLMDTIPELVSIAMHPLNKPVICENKVIKGYGIIAPKITTTLKSSFYSPFTKLFGGIGSSCAYDTLSAETYQDTFHKGIFAGKGLIDIDCYYNICCNKFKSGQVLSHDILEGEMLSTGFAGDIEFYDSFPTTTLSFYKRQHRWIRGDIQNINFIFNNMNDFSSLSRFKLFHNIQRAMLPINITVLLILAIFTSLNESNFLVATALFTMLCPFIICFILSIISNGFFSLTRKFYSKNISQTTEILSKAFYSIMLLPQTTIVYCDAVIRATYRKLISHKNLLQWTTSAQAEKSTFSLYSFISIYISPLIFGLCLLLSENTILKIFGIVYIISPIIVRYINIAYKDKIIKISSYKKEELISQLAAMIQFYEDYSKKQDNFLPPDNVQFAPVFRVCHRTSPTNIGLMMLSYLVARDFDIIDTITLYRRINNTLSTIEKIEKVCGHLYNWYDTETLNPSESPYISSVDCGNYLCCIVALKEGLKEYKTESIKIEGLITRLNDIIINSDMGFFYDNCKNLISIGYNPKTKEFSPNHYDLLMSEARMTSYYAIAMRQVPKKHWRTLGRTLGKNGLYSGPLSYSGTMFEFFMPELFLFSEPGSLSYEGLKFCIYCQKKYVNKKQIPYGTSESGYFAFDSMLNYQYKAHGVPYIGLKQGLENDLVISPYSSYLTLEHDFNNAFDNLNKLKAFNMYGKYGFYEAIDFTTSRVSEKGSIVKSYMAHHIGMSIISISNSLQCGRTKKRFMIDKYMSSANELLQEKIMPGNIVLEDIYRKPETQRVEPTEVENTLYDTIIATQPNVKLLSNGEYTLAVTDSGINVALYQGRDVYVRTTDLLRKPQGCFFALQTNSNLLHFSYFPEYKKSNEMSVEFLSDSVSFYTNNNEVNAGMKIQLHSNLPCEIRQFAIKNISTETQNISLMSYIQPILNSYSEHYAHPAFSKLFLKISYDYEHKVIIAKRKNKNDDTEIYFAVGFIEETNIFCNLSNEEILQNIIGINGIFSNSSSITQNYNCIPDPAIFLKTDIKLVPNQKKELNMFIITSLSANELLNNIAKIRHEKYVYTISSSSTPISSIEGRIVKSVFPQILFKRVDCSEILDCIKLNVLSLNSLWQFGISGDNPILVVEIQNIYGKERVVGYIKAFNVLRLCSILVDVVFIFKEKTYDSNEFKNMVDLIIDELKMNEFIGRNGGLHLINTHNVKKEIIIFLKSIAVHIAPQSMVRIQVPTKEYKPFQIKNISKSSYYIKDKLSIGGFNDDKYIIDSETDLPWCNVLASSTFGTLLSNNSLGFTYAINSRENKLTPWDNDTQHDNRGEVLILKCNDEYYDLVWGSTAIFSPEKAEYHGECDLFSSKVIVSVSDKAMTKKISLQLTWKSKQKKISIAFYTEPVLGVSRDNSRMNTYSYIDNCIIAKNPLNKDVSGYMSISSSRKPDFYTTDKNEFFSGNWASNSIYSSQFSCASLIIDDSIDNKIVKNYDFYISFGATVESAIKMQKLYKPFKLEVQNDFKLYSPDKNLNNIYNTWLYWQAIGGRIFARTGFYQNSGAWGFRDQLQDACGCLLKSPIIAKRQIIRACCAQFPEGDVLHWWHKLPNKIMRGVRTKISDDLLWLPYTVCEYLDKTDDIDILSINLPYCDGISLEPSQLELYGEVRKSDKVHSVYNHCKQAIDKAHRLGEHELILMGCGDWNDSFNKVGSNGQGESVWLSQFIIIVLKRFSEIASKVGDLKTKNQCLDRAEFLTKAIEDNCWDGEWYLRAFLDDGDELGSKNCIACQIDSLSQSFAVLGKLPDKERNTIAIESAYEYLVDKKKGLIKLFAPAFDNSNTNVGYATYYPRGIRENGGQYTHGAIWLAIAFFENQDTERGFELLQILNPANKYQNNKNYKIFKNEPYFMTADIYTNPQCYGRGGWSIYTGGASWYYRAITEWFLGIKIKEKKISFKPHLAKEWDSYSAEINYMNTSISIKVKHGKKKGHYNNDKPFDELILDGKKHNVTIIID